MTSPAGTRLHLADDIREIDFPIGSEVFLRVGREPIKGVVCGYYVARGDLTYNVQWGNMSVSSHHDFELSASRPYPDPN